MLPLRDDRFGRFLINCLATCDSISSINIRLIVYQTMKNKKVKVRSRIKTEHLLKPILALPEQLGRNESFSSAALSYSSFSERANGEKLSSFGMERNKELGL